MGSNTDMLRLRCHTTFNNERLSEPMEKNLEVDDTQDTENGIHS